MRIALLCLVLLTSLWAHRLNVMVSEEAEGVEVWGFFRQSSPCVDCGVKLWDKEGRLLAQSATDQEGKVHLKIATAGEFELLVDGGVGHQKRVKFEFTPEAQSSDERGESKGAPAPLVRPEAEVTLTGIAQGIALLALIFGALFWLYRGRG